VDGSVVETPPVRDTVTPEAPAWQAFLKLGSGRRTELPVVAGGRLVGVVTRRDLRDAMTERPGADVAHRAA